MYSRRRAARSRNRVLTKTFGVRAPKAQLVPLFPSDIGDPGDNFQNKFEPLTGNVRARISGAMLTPVGQQVEAIDRASDTADR